jgi:hypothetical protein
MEFLSLILALIGIGLAIAVPLRIEYLRRPILRIERAPDANQSSPPNGVLSM